MSRSAEEDLARRLCLAALELQAGDPALWISVGRIADRLGIDDLVAIDRAIAFARQAGWLSAGGTPPLSVLLKHAKLHELMVQKRKMPRRPG